ncbi:hypothetical protein [Actinosynnema sp. NPDC020468]|uniref:hypothetical protein n=1 Tax=Actinosynnema sp. NPDC020468 TaxID=3154488 RepID=UPI0033F80269
MDRTYAHLGARLVALGMVAEDRAREVAAPFGDEVLDGYDVREALVGFGVAVSAHTGDLDDLEDAYRVFLEDAAAVGGQRVADVALDGDELSFTWNGKDVVWGIDLDSAEYLDQLTLYERVNELDPADGRVFHALEFEDGDDAVYLLATPAAAAVLREEFGVDFDSAEGE